MEHLDAPAFSDRSLLEKCPCAAPLAQWCFAAATLLLNMQVKDASSKLSMIPLQEKCEPQKVQEKSEPRKRQKEKKAQQAQQAEPDLGGLFVKPRLWDLSVEELKRVEDLTIGREGVGQITFYGQTDCRDLLQNISQILSIHLGEIVVYPDASLKPPVGQGLNKPASVLLLHCMPKCRTRLADARAKQRYKDRVAQMTREKGAVFEDYDPNDGTWKFRVPHF